MHKAKGTSCPDCRSASYKQASGCSADEAVKRRGSTRSLFIQAHRRPNGYVRWVWMKRNHIKRQHTYN